MAGRQLGIIRRTSLKDVATGWSDCFVTFRPADLGELADLKESNPEKMTETQGIKFMADFIKSHTVGGQVMVVANDDGTELTSAPLEQADIDHFPADVLMQLFADMTGGKLDPKDIQRAQEAAEKSIGSEKLTETPSSTESETSQPTSSTTSTSSDTGSVST